MTAPPNATPAATPLVAPWAGPDWRWQRAHGASSDPAGPADDEFVVQAAAFVAAANLRQRDRQHPQTAAATRLWEQPAARRALETLALAAAPPARIAERLGVAESDVIWAERLLFDVRSYLSAVDWIECHVLAPLRRREQAERVVELQAALWGGANAAELILDGHAGALEGKLERLSAQDARLQKKTLVALQTPVTGANSLAWIRLTSDIDHAAQRLELAKKKFAHACDEARLKRDRTQARLEAAEEQRRTAAAAKQYRAERDQMLIAQRIGEANNEARRAERRAATSPLAELRWQSPAEVLPPRADQTPVIAPRPPREADARRRVRRKPRRRARLRADRHASVSAG
jgi:hypothetical protein